MTVTKEIHTRSHSKSYTVKHFAH